MRGSADAGIKEIIDSEVKMEIGDKRDINGWMTVEFGSKVQEFALEQ